MKLKIHIKPELQQVEMTQDFEAGFIEMISDVTSLGDDFKAAVRTESSHAGELLVCYELSLPEDKIDELNIFTERVCSALSECFIKDSQDGEISIRKEWS